MNDNDISKIIKQMPEDLIEESSEFAGNGVGKMMRVKKTARGGFFRHPAFSVAVSVLLFVISAAVVTGVILRNRSIRSNDVIQPGGNVVIRTDAADKDDGSATATPAPTSAPREPVLTDFTGAEHGDLYDFGILEMNDNTDRTGFLKKWERYVKEFFKDLENAGELTAEMLEYYEKLHISATSGKGYWMDISPRGIKGIGQIFRYEGVLPSDGDKSFRLDVLFADGEIRHIFPDNLSERTVYSIVPFYINNRETPGLLASTIASDGIGLDYALFVYDPEIGKVTEISPSVYNRALFVVKNGAASYVLDTRSWMGGEVEFDGSDMTIGGVTPYEFFAFLSDYSRENTTTPDPLSTQTAPYPETPTPTPEHTPVKTEVPTPAPTLGPTPIPQDDPSSLWYISSHSAFMTVANVDGGSITGPELIKAFYIYNGIGMEYMDLGSEYQVGYMIKSFTNSYKKGESIPIRADREICIIMNDDAELVSVDVWAVNDAADMENIAPELIASGLSETEFLDFVSSGKMQFRPNSEDGTALPCFAVFTSKKVCSYIEVTGEYEVLYKNSIIPFISVGAHNEDTVRLIRYNFSGDGVGIKEILPCDLADSLIRLLRNAKKTNIAVSAISDEPVNEFSETLPVAPGTLWIEIGSSIYRIDPDMTELCKVSSHLGEGELLELSGLLPVYLQQAWYYYPYDYYVEEYNCSTGISHINHTYTADTSIDIFHVVFDYAGSLRASGNLIVNIISDKDQTLTVRLECEKSEDLPGGGDSKEVSFKAGWQTEVYLAYEGWDDGPFWIYVTCDNTKYAVKVIP